MRDALLEATRLRLRADVPVGVYLSGGLDSCSLLGVAASLHPEPIEAFTIAFEEGAFDEGRVAEEMARTRWGELSTLPHDRGRPRRSLRRRHRRSARRCTFNANHVAKYLLSAGAGAGFKVVLTGEGSDEILGGYPFFRRDMLMYDDPETDAETTQDRVDEMPRRTVPTFVPTARRGLRCATPAPDFAAEFAGRDPYLMFLNRIDVRRARRARTGEPVDVPVAQGVFPNKLLNFLADRMEMAHSIEGRVPFLDHPLVELANRCRST